MPTFTPRPTTAADLIHEIEPYEEYLADLVPEEKAQAKAHLVATLSAMVVDHTESVVVFRAGLPPEQIRQAYLENLFPDEESAAAYLWALRPENDDSLIRKIEGEKEDVTDQMVNPLSHRRRQHAELLEMVWAVQKANDDLLVDPTQAILVKLFINYGDSDYQALFDTWAEAEISRVRMRRLVRDLRHGEIHTKAEVLRGTCLQGTKVSLRHWINAAAFVSQAKQCSTPEDLRFILGTANRITPGKMLSIIKTAMMKSVSIGNFRPGTIGVMDGLVPGHRLYFQTFGHYHNVNHRNDLMLRQIGNMMIKDLGINGPRAPRNGIDYTIRRALDRERDAIGEAFDKWIHPYHNAPAEMSTCENLAEFAYRYQDDKRRLMGWRLINSLLRTLLDPVVD